MLEGQNGSDRGGFDAWQVLHILYQGLVERVVDITSGKPSERKRELNCHQVLGRETQRNMMQCVEGAQQQAAPVNNTRDSASSPTMRAFLKPVRLPNPITAPTRNRLFSGARAA